MQAERHTQIEKHRFFLDESRMNASYSEPRAAHLRAYFLESEISMTLRSYQSTLPALLTAALQAWVCASVAKQPFQLVSCVFIAQEGDT